MDALESKKEEKATSMIMFDFRGPTLNKNYF